MPASASELTKGLDREAPFPDPDEFSTMMTIHRATFDRLVANRALNDQLPEFFADLAVTYARIARRLRGMDSR